MTQRNDRGPPQDEAQEVTQEPPALELPSPPAQPSQAQDSAPAQSAQTERAAQALQRAARLYRQESLREHADPRAEGDVLRISPAWTRWAYWVLVAFLAAGLVFCLVGTVYEYASGPAVVRVEGMLEVTVEVRGAVMSVEASPGQRVAAGQVLARLRTQDEDAALERIEREFELQLIRMLRDPGDQAARQVLTTLRAEQELAQARREARTIRAPRAGIVTDVRIHVGQYLQPGESVASLVDEDSQVALIALLPGSSRPFLQPGKSLRVELEGFEYEYRELTIDSVSDQVIGPAEVRRYLGPVISDALTLGGPQVLVKTRLPARSFVRGEQRLYYVDGMMARAEARLKEESILVVLIPGLKRLWSHETN